jgi:aminobenzoyl-glutamate transport protein
MSAAQNQGAPDAPKTAMQRILDTVERVGNRVPHPVMIFVYLIIFVVLLSALLSLLGAQVTYQA